MTEPMRLELFDGEAVYRAIQKGTEWLLTWGEDVKLAIILLLIVVGVLARSVLRRRRRARRARWEARYGSGRGRSFVVSRRWDDDDDGDGGDGDGGDGGDGGE